MNERPPTPEEAGASGRGTLTRRARWALIALSGVALGLGVALALIVASPPREQVVVTAMETVTETETPTTVVTTTQVTTTVETVDTVTETETETERRTRTVTRTVTEPDD